MQPLVSYIPKKYGSYIDKAKDMVQSDISVLNLGFFILLDHWHFVFLHDF